MSFDPFHTVGNHTLAAWVVEDGVCWVQSRHPAATKRLQQLVECRRVATGVAGGYLATFEVKRTLSWVRKAIVEKILAEFAKENGGSNSGKGGGKVLEGVGV